MPDNDYANAVQSLIKEAQPEHFREVLTDMWETWITSPATNNTDETERMDKLLSWKFLCAFFTQVENIEHQRKQAEIKQN